MGEETLYEKISTLKEGVENNELFTEEYVSKEIKSMISLATKEELEEYFFNEIFG